MLIKRIALASQTAVNELYHTFIEFDKIQVEKTNPSFEGDYTLVVFPFLRVSSKNPASTADEIGSWLCANFPWISKYNVVKGFLNISLSNDILIQCLNEGFSIENELNSKKPILLEFSSPNTNKPLHLGHIRNNLLGWSLSQILSAAGHKVIRLNLINDRGIHICKTMLAWEKWGNGETPASSGLKGDHLVGKYYVLFDTHLKAEIENLIASGMKEDEALKCAPLMLEAQQMLVRWEKNDLQVREIWATMNAWVIEGFEQTYKRLGISFDKIDFESNIYADGRDLVLRSLDKDLLQKNADGSVWIDLTDNGLDKKLLLRADGTTVYITQDIGTATRRFEEYDPERMIYVVGNEQNYHFDVLKQTLLKMGNQWAESIEHFSYGMVELPQGKMKSREGNVVDADDLMEEMHQTARDISEQLGKAGELSAVEQTRLYEMIGLGALKYYILKVDPRKNILFDPKESVDFEGNTGPFIQYTHARICSLLSKASEMSAVNLEDIQIHPREKALILQLLNYGRMLNQAASELNPGAVANYTYELARLFNQFYHELPVVKEEDNMLKQFRIMLTQKCGETIKQSMHLLGIDVPERM